MALNLFKSVREYLTPVLTESAFLEHGMLTPEEFVRAGDHFIRTCPTWKWESGEISKRRPYLPPDKQFLSTKGVPSYQRVSAFQSATYVDETIQGDNDGDWLAPTVLSANDHDDDFDIVDSDETNDNEKIKEDISKVTEDISHLNTKDINQSNIIQKSDDEYLDMEDETLALDESVATNTNTDQLKGNDGSVIKSRRYDVSITYDNYYRTPRIWLYGYNENGTPLTTEEIYQDVMQDYAKKTVTVDPHPHISKLHASIHPCRHGSAMLKIIQALQESNQTITIEQYMFIFLKFIQSVVPTIEYDYTIEVQAGANEK
eukprot:gene17428-22980_t